MVTSAQNVVDAIKNHQVKILTLEEKIEQKLNDSSFYMHEAIRYLQGYVYVIPGYVDTLEELENLKKKYSDEGWGFFIEHRGRMAGGLHVTIRLKLPDEFTSYLDECKSLEKQIPIT